MNVRLLVFRPITSFIFEGNVRELKEPNGPPKPRQLARLNYLGAIGIVEPGQVGPITKAQGGGRARRAGGAVTLVDRIEAVLLEHGPLPGCVIATTVRKQKAEVLAVLHGNPDRFVLTGKARASRWSVREVVNAVDDLPTFTVDELASRWKCDRAMGTTIVFGPEGFLERGYVASLNGNGRVRVTALGLELSAVLHDAADAWGWQA